MLGNGVVIGVCVGVLCNRVGWSRVGVWCMIWCRGGYSEMWLVMAE